MVYDVILLSYKRIVNPGRYYPRFLVFWGFATKSYTDEWFSILQC
jgi:hypothetical protein